MIGSQIGRYRILEEIGVGGMGVVYRAEDERLGREVALKVLPSGRLASEEARKRFKREALVLSQLNHPNIAIVHDFDSQDGLDFLVMEYIPGETLSDILSAGTLTDAEVVRLGIQLAEGLAVAHEHGVIHRDLKPGNLRVTPDGRLKILDFGLAKYLESSDPKGSLENLTQTQAVVGTPAYIAPEQLTGGTVDARADIFAAGVVLYEMATGKRPFPSLTGLPLLHAIMNQIPPKPTAVNSSLSPGLERVILCATEKEPEKRYPSVRDLLKDLRAIEASERVQGVRAMPRPALLAWLVLPVVAVALVVVLLGRFLGGPAREGPVGAPRIMLAVLPFANLSADPEQSYFSDGLTEEMITHLGKLDPVRLGVIASTSAMQYKGVKKGIGRIGQELGVGYVLEGTVRRSANQLRIDARLSGVKDQAQLWSESYDRTLSDVFAIQSDVAAEVAKALTLQLLPERKQSLARAPTSSATAHEHYLKGRYYWNRRTESGLNKAIESFRAALDVDSGYALAYAGLADAYLLLTSSGYAAPELAMPEAKKAAQRALALDRTLGEAHTSLASVQADYEWDWKSAEQSFKQAIQLDPGYATAHQWYADFLITLGRLDEATREIQLAHRLDPLSLIVNADLGSCYYLARRYDEAIDQYRRTLDLDSTFSTAYSSLGMALWQKGDHLGAIGMLQRAMVLSGASPEDTAGLRRKYLASGPRGFWLWKLEQLERSAAEGYVAPYEFATVYANLGDKERAFRELEKAYRERSGALTGIKVDVMLDPLRGDPRYRALLMKMKLPA